MKNLYTSELSVCASDITALPTKKQGRPLTLGEILDCDVHKYILRLAGTRVSVKLVQAAADVMAKDRTLLVENGGYIINQEMGRLNS